MRFGFGKNWQNYSKNINQAIVDEAKLSLKTKLSLESLEGKTFLDIGCGSGLFSLAAYQLGAKVHSFDYDQNSVECTKAVKKRFAESAVDWQIEQGSVLDKKYLESFEKFDIVYSWGVLHHTGDMLQAFENVLIPTKGSGLLFISIYNDQGLPSKIWTKIKKLYNGGGPITRNLLIFLCFIRVWLPPMIKDIIFHGNPMHTWNTYGKNRGMSPWYDLIDWVGGYPFEVATPELVFNFFHNRGWQLKNLTTCRGKLGCNEFVFEITENLKKTS